MDDRSERRLAEIHPDLAAVVRATCDDWTRDGNSLIVTEGVRTKARQEQLFRAGACESLCSRHLTGHAVALACKVYSEVRMDWPLYYRLGALMKSNALLLRIPMMWCGDRSTFKNGTQFELDDARYK